MALPAGIPDQKWKNYDFGANWGEFIRTWKISSVQAVLFYDMQNWCKEQAYYLPDGSKPTWKRGEPLWHLSRTDYWAQKQMDAANDYIERNDCFNKFKRTMAQQGRTFCDDDDARFAFHEICWEQIADDVATPLPDSLESLIMVMGREYLCDALATAATEMEVDDTVVQTPDCLILLPNKHMVFDFMSYYFDVVEGKGTPILKSDAEYDAILECINVHELVEA
jgi:hypothetical protein